MWILNRALKEAGYTTFPFIYQGELTIESVRVLSDGDDCTASLENVYVGHAADFFSSTEVGQLLLVSGSDIIFVEQGELCQVLNQIIHIFDLYRAWAERLTQASFDPGDPFQRMLDVIHERFQCPMLFGQKDLHVFATTNQYTDEEVYAGWDEVKRLHTIPIRMINSKNYPDISNYPDSIKTVAIPVGPMEGKHFDYQIRSNVYCGGAIWGHLYVYFNEKRLDPAMLQLARYAADHYGLLLDRICASDVNYKHEKYLFLCDAISGQEVAPEQVENIRWQLNWKKQQPLILYVLAFSQADKNDIYFDYMCRTLENNVRNEIVFPYNQQLLVIAPYEEDKLPHSLQYMKTNVLSIGYTCGVSYPFQALTDLPYAYFQATYAKKRALEQQLESKADNVFAYYKDLPFAGLIQYIKENINWKFFVVPQLFQLYEMDQENHTEYYRTLFWFLYNNGQAASTAKQLYIHRNTMKYRLDKILSLMQMDLTDNDVIAYLRICYCFMLEDYPIEPTAAPAPEKGTEA